jgi:acyl carrier protein
MRDEKNSGVLTTILDVAREVFGAAVSPADNFFDVGGDSVTAIQFATLLGNRFNREIYVEVVVESVTFAALASDLTSG